ncbi:MAG: hypothetical protein U1E76_15450 [Planctomycetota bacterium]
MNDADFSDLARSKERDQRRIHVALGEINHLDEGDVRGSRAYSLPARADWASTSSHGKPGCAIAVA